MAGWLEVVEAEGVEGVGGADTVMQPAARINVATKNSNTFPIYPS
jgi:hypothetical protein